MRSNARAILRDLLPKLRQSDTEYCFHFASSIRAPLSAVLPVMRPTDTKAIRQGLVALAAVYPKPTHPPLLLDTAAVGGCAMDSADKTPESSGTDRLQC
jgi:hypothetical protein